MYTSEMILYRNSEFQGLLDDFSWISENYNNKHMDVESLRSLLYQNMNKLIELSEAYGIKGNLWHGFLALFIADNENAFSIANEISGDAAGTIQQIAENDFRIFKRLFDYDFKKLETTLGVPILSLLKNYESHNSKRGILDRQIRDGINQFAEDLFAAGDAKAFAKVVVSFYKKFGAGKFGLHKAFRVIHQDGEAVIEPITNTETICLSDLIGYERQKEKLMANTEAFIKGRAANNVLLFGDSGTGKSSAIKAILNEYQNRGLRIIEVYKHQFQDLINIIAKIQNRNYKFIIYMDDLSFEDFELEYKYLKAVIEGGLGKKPDNVLIYATSNRRHLIREKFSDKKDISDELHNNDTVQEKLSLVARFGITIYFGAPDYKEFKKIVQQLAKRYHIIIEEEELYALANKWELIHGGLSGRTAMQFITYLLGERDNE